MNLSFDASDFTSQVSLSSIPALLWAYYVQYLWNYESGSWVARIAYSCRILAVLVSLPIIILGLLDIASYAIARTLGVIDDDMRASTSSKTTVLNTMMPPSIQIGGTSTPESESAFSDSDSDSLTYHSLHNKMRSPLSDSSLRMCERRTHFSQSPVYYAGEDSNLTPSDVGVFSPAASRPPSPTFHLPHYESTYGKEQLRHRV